MAIPESIGSPAETATLGKKITRQPTIVHAPRSAPHSHRRSGVLGGVCRAFCFGLFGLGCFGALFDISAASVIIYCNTKKA
jgi:hypothetical protein